MQSCLIVEKEILRGGSDSIRLSEFVHCKERLEIRVDAERRVLSLGEVVARRLT